MSSGAQGADPRAQARARRRGLALVLAVALVARLLSLSLFWDARFVFDEKYYLSVASSIAAGEGHRTFGAAELSALRPPLWAGVLAAELWAAGQLGLTLPIGVMRGLQIPLSLATVALLFDLAARRFGTRAGTLTGLAAALCPPLVHYAHFLWAESLAALLVTLLFWLLDRFERRRRARDLAAAGVALALLILTKEAWLYFSAVIGVWAAWCLQFERRRVLRALAAGAAALFLTLGPWTLRNALVFGDFVLVSSMQWWPIAIGNLPDPSMAEKRELMRRARELPEAQQEDFYRQVALSNIRSQLPGWLPRKLLATVDGLYQIRSDALRFADEGWIRPGPSALRALVAFQLWGHTLLLLPGIAALWLVRGGPLQLLVALAVLYLNGIHTLANAITRYAVALVPLYLLYLGPLLAGAWRGRPPRAWQWAGAGICAAAFALIPLPRSWAFLAGLLSRAG